MWGSAEELAEHLLSDPAVVFGDELLLGIHPAHVTIEETVQRAATLIQEVVPLVAAGWLDRRAALEQSIDAWELEGAVR